MATSDVVLAMLRGYVSKTHQIQVRLPQFAAFVQQYAENYQHKHASLRMFLENTTAMLAPVLNELAETGQCLLEFDGNDIEQIIFTPYLNDKIRAAYQEISQDPKIPFPNEESLRLTASSSVTTVDIKTEFVRWLSARPTEPQILRLSFPENIVNMLITTDLLERKLLEHAVMKIRSYLSIGNNSGYILQRLKENFTLKEQVLQSTLRDIVTRPGQVVDNLVKPTEFTFSFWAHLATSILKEFRDKTDKLVQDHAYSQACYLIGLYNVYYKGLSQRDHEIEVALKNLDKRFMERPFHFTIGDIYNLRDGNGVAITKRVPQERLEAFLNQKTRPSSEDRMPELIRVRTHTKKEYFIHRDVLLRFTLSRIAAATLQYKDDYIAEWFENLGDFKKTPTMLHDEVFLKDLNERLKEDDPLLFALLSFELLYLCRRERTTEDDVSRKVDRILDLKRQSLVSLDEILGVRRRDMLAEARLKLPLWKTIPLFKHVFHLFDRMLGGRKKRRATTREDRGTVKVLSDGSVGGAGRGVRGRETAAGGRSSGGTAGGVEVAVADQFGPYAVPDLNDLGGPEAGERTAPVNASGEGAASRNRAAEKSDERPARSSRGPTARQQAAAYKQAVEKLAEQILGRGQSIDARLKELAAKWNPLIAEKAKRNLIEDVNSFVRDQVRLLRRSTLRRPPDLERVENLSARIADSKIFADIKRKVEFREYIKLYLIKVLGKV